MANSTLLLGAWALAALTLSEVSRGALLLAGGPFPLDLRHAVVGGVPAERRKRVIGRLRDPVILRAGCLTVLVVALSVVALGIPPQPGGAPAAGDARVAAAVVLATDVVVAAFACAQRTLHTRRALTLLTFGTAFTCVALVSLVIGL